MEDLIGIAHPKQAGFLSSQLVGRIGSLGGPLAARRRNRTLILGDARSVEETFQRVSATLRHRPRDQIAARPVLPGDTLVVSWLRGVMAFDPVEQFRILFLNAGGELSADKVMGVGTVPAVQFDPREIMKRGISWKLPLPSLRTTFCREIQNVADRSRHNASHCPGSEISQHYHSRPLYRRARWLGEFPASRVSEMSGPMFSPPHGFRLDAAVWKLLSDRPGRRQPLLMTAERE